jgi:hypothetical protein
MLFRSKLWDAIEHNGDTQRRKRFAHFFAGRILKRYAFRILVGAFIPAVMAI